MPSAGVFILDRRCVHRTLPHDLDTTNFPTERTAMPDSMGSGAPTAPRRRISERPNESRRWLRVCFLAVKRREYRSAFESQFPAATATLELFFGLRLGCCASAVRALHCASLSHRIFFQMFLAVFGDNAVIMRVAATIRITAKESAFHTAKKSPANLRLTNFLPA